MSQEEVGPVNGERKPNGSSRFEEKREQVRRAAVQKAVTEELRRRFPRSPQEAQLQVLEGYVQVEDAARHVVRNRDDEDPSWPLSVSDADHHYLVASFLREAALHPDEHRELLGQLADVVRKGVDPARPRWGPSVARDGASHPYFGLARQCHRLVRLAATHSLRAANATFMAEADRLPPPDLTSIPVKPASRGEVALLLHVMLIGELKASIQPREEEQARIYNVMPLKPGGRLRDSDCSHFNSEFVATCRGGAEKQKLDQLIEQAIRAAFKEMLGLETKDVKNLFPER